jgi:hypothetical protein
MREVTKMLKLNIPEELKQKIKKQKHGRIIAIYDSESFGDRYSVYFNEEFDRQGNKAIYCMSSNPFHPQGIGQWSAGKTGKHNGKSISFDRLPLECRQAISNIFDVND